MKYFFIVLAIITLGSCNSTDNETKHYMDIAIINDVTDFHLLRPAANPILNLYNISEHKSAEVNFRYRVISDKVLVPVVNLRLPSESIAKKTNNKNLPLFREKMILNFYDTIRKTLSLPDSNKDSSFLDHSECIKTISYELTLMTQSSSKERVLIVFSNLFENSTLLSVYDEGTKNLLIQNPEKVAAQFEKHHLLPENLNGIKVVFVFQPATRDEDFVYLKMIEVYKLLLEKRGAQIKVQADNTYLN